MPSCGIYLCITRPRRRRPACIPCGDVTKHISSIARGRAGRGQGQYRVSTLVPGAIATCTNQLLRLRQAASIIDVTATQAATQVGSITTVWLPSSVGSTNSYVEVIYTQTFAAVPDQWPSPIAGSIGLGTLAKRQAAAETGKPIAGRFKIM